MTISEFAKTHGVERWTAERAAHWAFKSTGNTMGGRGRRREPTKLTAEDQRLMLDYISRPGSSARMLGEKKRAALFEINRRLWMESWLLAAETAEVPEDWFLESVAMVVGALFIIEKNLDWLELSIEEGRFGDLILTACQDTEVERQVDGIFVGFTAYLVEQGFERRETTRWA